MQVKILGVNSDHDTCNRCGKTNLKRVVWVQIDECEPEPVGSDCAGRLMKKTGNAVWKIAQDADEQKKKDERNFVHQIGDNRSVVDFYVVRVNSAGEATVLCRANGSKKEVQAWAESKFGFMLEVSAPVAMQCYSKVNW